MLCEYGCGQEALYQFGNGVWCCSSHYLKCPIHRENRKGKNNPFYNKKHTEETKNLIHIRMAGENNPRYGVKLSDDLKQKISESLIGLMVKEKNPFYKKRHTKKSLKQMSMSLKYSIKDYKISAPLFSKIEEMRYNPDKLSEKEIQVHCKNHNCENSREKGGWFTPTYNQFHERIRNIEKFGEDKNYLYCSEECKEDCPLYGKRVSELIKQNQINAGIIEDPWYTSGEYQLWRTEVLKLDNNICQFCGEEASIAHHIMPQKIYPNLALDPDNGIACCKECHFKYGHRDKKCTTGYLSKLICERIIKVQDKIKQEM